MDKTVNQVVKQYSWFAILSSAFLVISSVIYLFFEFYIEKKITDILFLSLTLFESLFVIYSGYMIIKYIQRKSVPFYTSLDSFTEHEKPKEELTKIIINFICFSNYWFIILIWASVMATVPYFQSYWENNLILNVLFGVFLFFTNIITSYFVILLILFFVRIRHVWSIIKVELWKRENVAARFIFSLSKRITIIAAIYMTSSLTAWNTSGNISAFNNAIIIFFAFSVLVLISSIIVPLLPFASRIGQLKNDALRELDGNIQSEYSILLDKFKIGDEKVNFDRMNELLAMRKRIEGIFTFPFQLKTITASISIIFISLLPKIIELILVKLFN